MSGAQTPLFGRIALVKGLLTESQLARALRFQEEIRALGLSRPLGRVLVDDGILAEGQVDLILRLQEINERARQARRFGRVALKNALITPEDLKAALKRGSQEAFQRPLSQLLVDQGALSPRHARAVEGALRRADDRKKHVQTESAEERAFPSASNQTGRLAQAIDLEDEDEEEPQVDEAAQWVDDLTFAALAVREGLLHLPELERAARDQVQRDQPGSLREVLIERGTLSAEEADSVAKAVVKASREVLTIPGYEVTDVLGYGVTSIVVEGRNALLDREVAIKIFRPEHVAATSAEVLTEEARAVARVQHENVVGVYEVGRVNRRVFFVMELVRGPTLLDRIRREGPLPEREVLSLCRDVTRGLAAIHAAGMVHRDVKPQNILLAEEGAKLTDLGLVCEQGYGGDANALYGSPYTMSPEQAQGLPIDARADLYGLGATLFYALTETPPYEDKSALGIVMRHVTDPVQDPRARVPGLTNATADLVMRLMAKEPDDRPADAEEVVRALNGLLAFEAPPEVLWSPPEV